MDGEWRRAQRKTTPRHATPHRLPTNEIHRVLIVYGHPSFHPRAPPLKEEGEEEVKEERGNDPSRASKRLHSCINIEHRRNWEYFDLQRFLEINPLLLDMNSPYGFCVPSNTVQAAVPFEFPKPVFLPQQQTIRQVVDGSRRSLARLTREYAQKCSSVLPQTTLPSGKCGHHPNGYGS